MAREITNKVYELMDEGVLSPRAVAEACLRWMSEDDVRRCGDLNGWFYEDEDDDREPNPRRAALGRSFVLLGDGSTQHPYTLIYTKPFKHNGASFYYFVDNIGGKPRVLSLDEENFRYHKRDGYRVLGHKAKVADLPRSAQEQVAFYVADLPRRAGH
jgi:hypothetical protein